MSKMASRSAAARSRVVMADLEEAGLLAAPHTSAGRIPTETGLRLFVHGLLEVGSLTSDERANIDVRCSALGRSLPQVLEEASQALSGLSQCAGLVLAPKTDAALKHIEFVPLGPGRALVVLVTEDGLVENRIIDVPVGLPPSSLTVAGNYLNARLVGSTIAEAMSRIDQEISAQREQLDDLTQKVVTAGLAMWSGQGPGAARNDGYLIVRGQSNLLGDVTQLEDLERIRALFQALEAKEAMVKLLDAAQTADGVQIYIGAESDYFSVSGCSVIIAPYTNAKEQIVGAIGVIGPTRMNYARIIPMVDYTAKVIGNLLR
jgi:heat-inducible transcriptional repressor